MKICFRVFVSLAILAVLLSLLGGCASPAASTNGAPEFYTVQRGPLASSITAIGSVHARSETKLSFDVSGRVSEVLVQAGQRVEKGAELARLDPADLK